MSSENNNGTASYATNPDENVKLKEFVSKVEEIIKAKELRLGRSPGFGKYKQFFPESSKAHPAKADVNLLEYLIQNYTKEGETILDPMAGTGSTAVLAALFGRNGIGIDIEEKFYRWGLEAKETVEKYETITPKGKIEILKGDARKLSEVLRSVDSVLTSPPYSNQQVGKGFRKNRWEKIKDREGFKGRKEWMTGTPDHYGDAEGQIGNLPHGSIDSVITSPPYADSVSDDKEGPLAGGNEKIYGRWKKGTAKKNSYTQHQEPIAREVDDEHLGEMPTSDSNEENIGNLRHGDIDSIITSPPYSEGQFDYKHGIKPENFSPNMKGRKAFIERRKMEYSEDNITTLKHGNIDEVMEGHPEVDSIITSPPYSNSYLGGGDSEKRKERLVKAGYDPKEYLGGTARNSVLKHYSESEPENKADDAKDVSGVDTIITSPPYSNISSGGHISPHMQGLISKLSGIPVKEFAHNREKFMEAWKIAREKLPKKYSEGLANIGNLPHGDIDAIITSPPYADLAKPANIKVPITKEEYEQLKAKGENVYHDTRPERKDTDYEYYKMIPIEKYGSKENIDTLPHGSIDSIITSPPYADSKKGSPNVDDMIKRWNEHYKPEWNSWGKSWETEGRKRSLEALGSGYSESDENIGNLKYGDIDSIITSPPYSESIGKRAGGKMSWCTKGETRRMMTKYSDDEENIGNLKHGNIDSIITSPPYGHESTASKPTKLEMEGKFSMGHSKEEPYTEESYREWDKHVGGNIGKRRMFVRVPCKPEEADYHDTRPERKGTVWEWTKEVLATPEVIEQIQKLKSEKKGKSETYLEAMYRCYAEMYSVLRPGGKAIIIVKPFIRNKKVIDLPYETYLLLSRVGFKLVDVLKFRLEKMSFWRHLYYRKHPEVPVLAHEYILVCEK